MEEIEVIATARRVRRKNVKLEEVKIDIINQEKETDDDFWEPAVSLFNKMIFEVKN